MRMWLSNSLKSACVSIHTYCYFLSPPPFNKYFTSFTTFQLCRHCFLQSWRARALSLTTGLMARTGVLTATSWPQSLGGNSSPASSCYRLRPPEISLKHPQVEVGVKGKGVGGWVWVLAVVLGGLCYAQKGMSPVESPCGGVLGAPGPPTSHLCLELDLRWTGPERGLPQRQLRSQETAQSSWFMQPQCPGPQHKSTLHHSLQLSTISGINTMEKEKQFWAAYGQNYSCQKYCTHTDYTGMLPY